MARRIGVCGMSVPAADAGAAAGRSARWAASGGAVSGCGAAAGAPLRASPAAGPGCPAESRSRSRRTTRPFGPDPAMVARSMPSWRAILRTIGLANRRVWAAA